MLVRDSRSESPAGGSSIAARESRPELTAQLSAEEFRRWYWTKLDLTHFVRSLAPPTSGGKQLNAAALDGTEFAASTARPTRARQLSGALSPETLIPRGQRCSQAVRAWFIEQVGTGFRFDAPLWEFFRVADGTATLGDALAHWHATRGSAATEIGPQFEYNRFTHHWYTKNPGGPGISYLAPGGPIAPARWTGGKRSS